MVVSGTTECVHDATSSPLSTLVLNAARAIKESSSRADERKTGVSLRGSGSIGAVLFYERVERKFGGVQCAMEIHLDCLEIGRLRRVFRTYRFRS